MYLNFDAESDSVDIYDVQADREGLSDWVIITVTWYIFKTEWSNSLSFVSKMLIRTEWVWKNAGNHTNVVLAMLGTVQEESFLPVTLDGEVLSALYTALREYLDEPQPDQKVDWEALSRLQR